MDGSSDRYNSDKDCCLGIDTSNYKTSVAVTDRDGNILFDSRRFLNVKRGNVGLRQSEALFQHVGALPDIIAGISKSCGEGVWDRIACISVSSRPRPVEGSYMPAFLAGLSTAESLSEALRVPLYRFSHQEGHIEAVRYYTPLKNADEFISFHFSGGTTEAIEVKEGNFNIVGGTKDIAFGQLIDRAGVLMGIPFPCGAEMDKLAGYRDEAELDKLPDNLREMLAGFKIPMPKVKDGFINLSGEETSNRRFIESNGVYFAENGEESKDIFAKEVSYRIFTAAAETMSGMTISIANKTGIRDFIFAGGVSSSLFIRKILEKQLSSKVNIYFGKPELSTDNAVGISLLGGLKYGFKTHNSITA